MPTDRLSLLGRTLPPGLRTRLLAIPPGATRPYLAAEWEDALVVVESGELELRAHGGQRLRLGAGALLALADLPLRELANTGDEPVLISTVKRKETAMPQKITPSLWFDSEAELAAQFYCEVFDDSAILQVAHYTEAGPRPAGMVLTVEFELAGQRFIAINGGPQFKFDEAISMQVSCADQEEIDYFWSRLSEGGEEGQCGWLKDRFGLSWQITPAGMAEFFAGPPERARRAMEAMLAMHKIDLAAMCAAADGTPAV